MGSGLSETGEVRAGDPADVERVTGIQAGSPEAAAWDVRDYLDHDFRVFESAGMVVGFAVARRIAADESE